MVSIEVARRVRVPLSDAEVRRIVCAVVRGNQKKFSPLPRGRGSERGWGNGFEAFGSHSKHSDVLLSIAFITPRDMRRLNRTYHGEDRVTDVLSFGSSAAEQQSSKAKRKRGPAALLPHRPAALLPPGPAALLPPGPAATIDLGELVVCPDRVKRQAKQAGEPFRRELTRVLVHGTLHLLGEDHATPHQAERMFGMQEQLVQRIVKTLNPKS